MKDEQVIKTQVGLTFGGSREESVLPARVIPSESVDICNASEPGNHQTPCWGCGLNLIFTSYSPIFKCGWCGAITNRHTSRTPDSPWFSWWRNTRDCFFIFILLIFMLFVIGAGIWAVYPAIFSTSYLCGIIHCIFTAILSMCTISTFLFSSFCSPGLPPVIFWGKYPDVAKGGLENYTFCTYCAKPKCPNTHHCRSCRICVLDMDHHCPFIGNCVGAGNHRFFVSFLISVVISCTYVVIMTLYSIGHIGWSPLEYRPSGRLMHANSIGALVFVKQFLCNVVSSALFLSARGFVLIYLAMACFSVEIGISVLLFQQLRYIYEGKTYINYLRFNKDDGDEIGKKGMQNIVQFFNCPFWVSRLLLGSLKTRQSQENLNIKTL